MIHQGNNWYNWINIWTLALTMTIDNGVIIYLDNLL